MFQATVRVGVLATWMLWGLVGLCALAAWITFMSDVHGRLPALLGLSAAVLVGPATVAHVRLYVCRLAFLIRSTSPSPDTMPPPATLRSIGG